MTVDEHDWIVLGDMLRQARHSIDGRLELQWNLLLLRLAGNDRSDVANWLWEMAEACHRRDD